MNYYTVSVVLMLAYTLYYWIKRKSSYWSERGVDGPKPLPFVGNSAPLIVKKKGMLEWINEFYYGYPTSKYVGIYSGAQPTLILRDPEVIKQVLIKDFNKFQDRGVAISGREIEKNLVASEGDTWRVLRQKLTPIFTSGKLKNMIPLVLKSMNEFLEYTDNLTKNNNEHELRVLAAKYTMDVIGSCAFGVEVDAFNDKKANAYRVVAKRITQTRDRVLILRLISSLFPMGLLKMLGIKVGTDGIYEFFLNLVQQITNQRMGKPKVRNDFMDLMIELKEEGRVTRKNDARVAELEITDEIIAAQAFIFYVGGFETSSTTMSFLLYELSQNPDIQDRVYKEINTTIQKHGGVTYETINELHYLEQVFDETLRKYPVLPVLLRKCCITHTFPDSKLTLDKGVAVMVPVLALHHDPKYFPDPEKFDPERFSPENKAKIPPCVYLPFGDGPRNCIGMRFGKVQSMIGLAGFLNKFKVEPSTRSTKHLEIDRNALLLAAKTGIWVNIKRR